MKKATAPFVNVAGLLLLVPLLMLWGWLVSCLVLTLRAKGLVPECEHRAENGWYLLKGTCKHCGKELK